VVTELRGPSWTAVLSRTVARCLPHPMAIGRFAPPWSGTGGRLPWRCRPRRPG